MDANTTVIERHLALVEGIEVEYLVAGDGPEVVLLHGLGDSAEDWREVMARLAPSYRLYAPTLPGFGGDLGADGDGRRAGGFDPSPDGYARFVHAFVAAKDLRRPVLAGHSIGGLVALRAALNQPDGLRGLVLAAAAGLGRAVNPLLQAYALPGFGDVAASVARTAPGAALRAVSKVPMVFGRPWRVRHAWLLDQFRRAQDGRFMETTMRALRGQVGIRGQRRVVLDELPELSLPTLVLWGDSDRVVPLAQGYAAVARLPAGRLEVLGGAGHLAHVEDPDRAAAAMRRFLDELH
jgi:pimeloyl-ACP methyl ester carboxylesterase